MCLYRIPENQKDTDQSICAKNRKISGAFLVVFRHVFFNFRFEQGYMGRLDTKEVQVLYFIVVISDIEFAIPGFGNAFKIYEITVLVMQERLLDLDLIFKYQRKRVQQPP